MKNFIIIFSEKSGSSPIIKTLDNFESINTVGFEPFEQYQFVKEGYGKNISLKDFRKCLDIIFSPEENKDHCDRLNGVLSKYREKENIYFSKKKCFGFKMRLKRKDYMKEVYDSIKRRSNVIFFLIRKDIFRWALSKYHGDGTGKEGHMQFDLADNKIDIKNIPKLKVEYKKLMDLIRKCERDNGKKIAELKRLRKKGIRAYPIYYEDFCNKKFEFFKSILQKLEIYISDEEINEALKRDLHFKKVHSNDIRDFVINPQEAWIWFRNYPIYKKRFSVRIQGVLDYVIKKVEGIIIFLQSLFSSL